MYEKLCACCGRKFGTPGGYAAHLEGCEREYEVRQALVDKMALVISDMLSFLSQGKQPPRRLLETARTVLAEPRK